LITFCVAAVKSPLQASISGAANVAPLPLIVPAADAGDVPAMSAETVSSETAILKRDFIFPPFR
jgi:hypothetical protein